MIDTIHLKYQLRGTSDHERLLGLFSRWGKSSYSNAGRVFYKSLLRNLEIDLSDQFLRIRGSLAKFYLGNNIMELTPEQIKLALFELSHLLQTNILSAELRRIDISHCFYLRNSISDYLACFEDTPEFKKYYRVTHQTKTYAKENYAIVFYDKRAESRKNKEISPLEPSNSNILRIELQLQRRLIDELKRKKIYAVHLCARGFLSELIERWREEYFSIYTRNLLINDMGRFPKKMKRQMNFVRNVEDHGGRSRLHEFIDRETRAARTSPNQKKYFKAVMRNLYSEKAFFQEIPILSELHSKVRGYYLITSKRLTQDGKSQTIDPQPA